MVKRILTEEAPVSETSHLRTLVHVAANDPDNRFSLVGEVPDSFRFGQLAFNGRTTNGYSVDVYDKVGHHIGTVSLKDEYLRDPKFAPNPEYLRMVEKANKRYDLKMQEETRRKELRKNNIKQSLGTLVRSAAITAAAIGIGVGTYKWYNSPSQIAQRAEEQRKADLEFVAISLVPKNILRLDRYNLQDGREAIIYDCKLKHNDSGSGKRLCIDVDGKELFVSEFWESWPEGDAINLEGYEIKTEAGWIPFNNDKITPELQTRYENLIQDIAKVKK